METAEQLVLGGLRSVKFRVPLSPIGQGSMNTGKAGNMYHSQGEKLTTYRDVVHMLATQQMRGQPPIAAPCGVVVTATFYFRQPKTNTDPYPTDTSPGVFDIDKLARAINDALQARKVGNRLAGGVFVNDSQVIDLHVRKRWGIPSAEIHVQEVPA